ncbi:hypothetical protein LINPERHAP1_LOCUS5889, partial [Linum perenne]
SYLIFIFEDTLLFLFGPSAGCNSSRICAFLLRDTPLSEEEDLLVFDLVDQPLPICGIWLYTLPNYGIVLSF